MEQIIAGIPMWAIWSMMGVHILALTLSALIWWKLEETPLETMGEGFLGWGALHEVPETIIILPMLFVPLGMWSVQFAGKLMKMVITIFMRGFCVIGPALTLLSIERIYADKVKANYKEMAIVSLLLIGMVVLAVNLTFWTLPTPVLAILYYSPIVISFITSGLLLWKAGYSKKWITAFGFQGGGHEAFEIVVFGIMGIKMLRGAIDPKIPGFIIVVFLVLQILGPLALYFLTRGKKPTPS